MQLLARVWLTILVKWRNFLEFLRVIFAYYGKFSFAKIDLSLLALYLFENPFRMSKRFLQRKGEDEVDVYGETPLTTLDFIAKNCEITKEDKVFELGCGRGRTCFWLNAFIGCEVVGVEFVPGFMKKANQIKKLYGVEKVTFFEGDMLKADFDEGSVFYLYGTCYDEPFIKTLIEKFKNCPPNTKIITVSYPLNDYCDEEVFSLIKTFSAPFTWGFADVYLQIFK